jgi:hypothetical protein
MPRYFAQIDVPPGDADSLQRASHLLVARGIDGSIVVEEEPQSETGTTLMRGTLQLELDGPTKQEVARAAQAAYRDLRDSAQLAPDGDVPITLIPVNALLHLDLKSSTFFQTAERLFDDSSYLYSVVAVQTAFELYIEGVFEYLLSLRTPREIGSAVQEFLNRKHSLSDQRVVALLEALTGESIVTSDEWRAYRQHLKRRNKLVHDGEQIGREEAAASLTAVRDIAGEISSRVRKIQPQPARDR